MKRYYLVERQGARLAFVLPAKAACAGAQRQRARGRSALLRCRLHRSCLTGLPPRCFAHRARSAPPSQPGSAGAVWLSDTGVALLSHMEKKEKRTTYASLSFGCRQLPIFPGNAVRHQRAAALSPASPVSPRASASLLRPPGALRSALSARQRKRSRL